jgi:hypothetical protein
VQEPDALFVSNGSTIYRIDLKTPGTGPAVMANNQSSPGALTVVQGMLYWTNYEGGQLMRVPSDGGTAELVASGLNHPRALATDDNRVFWVNEGTDGGNGSVMVVGVESGPPQLLSMDSTLPDGGFSQTGAAPTAITTNWYWVSNYPSLPTLVKAPVWADGPSRVLWTSIGARATAVTYPFIGSWDPRQLFVQSEGAEMFSGATHGLYKLNSLYVPGDKAYEAPFNLVQTKSFPASTVMLGAPNANAWTDGSSVEISYRIY